MPHSPQKARRGSHGAEADAINTITQCIRDGQFAPGQRLSESFLTKEFGFSRNTIREALRYLAATGLIQFETNKGARVVLLDRDDVASLYRLREVVEGLGAALAATNINFSGHRNAITQMLEEVRRLRQDADTAHFFEHNFRFHRLVSDQASNKYVDQTLQGLQIPALRSSYFDDITTQQYLHSLAEHEGILEAILDGAAPQAEALMRSHVADTRRALMRLSEKDFKRIYQGV
ncbi:MAG: GntR family transcriptional regulator [Pseudomonadota bacterium]